MSRLTILTGTMTGTSEEVAEEISDALEVKGHEAEIKAMDGLTDAVFEAGGIFLICASTYGQGDVPDNAKGIYEGLLEKKPDLSHVAYGVFALGDSTYDTTFCHGGHRFDEILSELGASRIGEVAEHDASAGTIPEEEGAIWAGEWADLLAVAEETLKKKVTAAEAEGGAIVSSAA